MLKEAKTSRPRPELRGLGQDYEVEAEAKINYEKSTKEWSTTYDLRLLPEKLTKFPNFTWFLYENAHYIVRQRDWGQAEAKTLRPRPRLRGRGWGQGFKAEAKDLTSLLKTSQLVMATGGCLMIQWKRVSNQQLWGRVLSGQHTLHYACTLYYRSKLRDTYDTASALRPLNVHSSSRYGTSAVYNDQSKWMF